MKVITFSRYFPTTHPNAGKPTWFVEKIWKSLWDEEKTSMNPLAGYWELYDEAFPCRYVKDENIHEHSPKHHTIRAGNRWKVGEEFSPRVWVGKPYCSKQLQFAPPIQIKKIFDVEINFWQSSPILKVNGKFHNHGTPIAQNDGLSLTDFMSWFPKPFTGQCICWSDSVEY